MRPTRRDLLLAAFAAVLTGCTLLLGAGPHDEGLMLAAADRIADGQVPYRDFWWNYGPGQPFLLGALTAIAGPSLLAWRIVHVAVVALVAVLAARFAAAHGAGGRWATAAGMSAASALAWPAGPGPGPTALALVLVALLVVDTRPGVAGAVAGAAALFRPELGLAAALGSLVLARNRRPLAFGFLIVAGAGYGALLAIAGRELPDQMIGFLGIQDLQRLPFPFAVGDAFPDPNKVLEAAFPALLLGITGLCAALLLRDRRRVGRGALALVPLVVSGLAYLLARTDEFHIGPLGVALAVLLAVLGAGAAGRAGPRLAALGLVVVLAHGIDRQAGLLLHHDGLATLPGPVADGVRGDAAFARGVAFVRGVIDDVPGPVLVAPPRYDRVRFGAPLAGVLLRRKSPSRYDVIQPGVVTQREVQREIAGDLARTRAPWVVRWIAPQADRAEPNGSGRSSGVRLLDDVIRRDYVEVARDAQFVVLARRGT